MSALRTTTVYKYDSLTGAFLSEAALYESEADRRETEDGQLSEPVFNEVPFITRLAPPSEDHVFDVDLGVWVDFGEFYDHALAMEKEFKRVKLNGYRDAKMAQGFDFGGSDFDSDPASIQKINGAVTMAIVAKSAGQPFSMTWTTADNGEVVLDADNMIALGVACAQRIDELHQLCVEKKADMMTLTAIAAVRDYHWE